jgi:hypothetical protein
LSGASDGAAEVWLVKYTVRVIAQPPGWLLARPLLARPLLARPLLALPLLVVVGCAAPQFTYVADSQAQTYFKVPNYWHKIDDSSLAGQLKRNGFTAGGIWESSYDAAGIPSASHANNALVRKPLALAAVATLSKPASDAMSYNLLRDIVLPVTPTSRQGAASRGFQLTHFQLFSDSVITPGKDVHGIREIYSYTFPDGSTYTFDQVALTNSDSTMVYVLLVHCLSTCYSKNSASIDTVMKSFTVGNP